MSRTDLDSKRGRIRCPCAGRTLTVAYVYFVPKEMGERNKTKADVSLIFIEAYEVHLLGTVAAALLPCCPQREEVNECMVEIYS